MPRPKHSNSEDSVPKAATRYHIILFQFGSGNIDRDLLRNLQIQLDATIITPPDQTEIDVWIESPGGDAHVSYKMILELRSRARRLQAIIPDYAKSAATLLAIGMDSIYDGSRG